MNGFLETYNLLKDRRRNKIKSYVHTTLLISQNIFRVKIGQLFNIFPVDLMEKLVNRAKSVFPRIQLSVSGLIGFEDFLKIGFESVSGLEKLRQNRRFLGFG